VRHQVEGYGRRHGVGIGIQQVALGIEGQRGKHRRQVLAQKLLKLTRIYRLDIAHVTVIDRADRPLPGTDQVRVGPGQADGVRPPGLELRHDLFVDQPAVHHRHHVEHGAIRNAAAFHHGRLNSEFLGHLRGDLPPAMN